MGERRTAAWGISVLLILSIAAFLPAEAAERPEVPADWQTRAQRQLAEAEYAVTLAPTWQAPNRAQGDQVSAVFAASIATAGDVNGDGYADVIVGAPNFDNEQTDEGRAFVYHGSASGLPQPCQDVDVDGYTDCTTACVLQPGQICGDCRDDAPMIHPGATEVCDGGNVDEDCDGLADDADPEGAAGKGLRYLDADGDGYGAGPLRLLCHGATVASDCNDNDPTTYPGATEVVGDGVDEDCDGNEICLSDADDDGAVSDGYVTSADTDCDDAFEARASDPIDNCPFDFNPMQSDVDHNGQGDFCDFDDGLIYVYSTDRNYREWQVETGYSSWNSYRGSLAALRTTGMYTQAPGSSPLVARDCGVTDPYVFDDATPATGEVTFNLVTGVAGGVESGLRTNSAGTPRANASPCP